MWQSFPGYRRLVCGALMFGESGTSATGRTYYYYKCANVKRRKGCNKKTVQKDWLEDLVVRETMKLIQDDAVIDKIVQLVMDVQNQENTTIPLLITFNYKDGTQTVRFEDTLTADGVEGKSSDLSSSAEP